MQVFNYYIIYTVSYLTAMCLVIVHYIFYDNKNSNWVCSQFRETFLSLYHVKCFKLKKSK